MIILFVILIWFVLFIDNIVKWNSGLLKKSDFPQSDRIINSMAVATIQTIFGIAILGGIYAFSLLLTK